MSFNRHRFPEEDNSLYYSQPMPPYFSPRETKRSIPPIAWLVFTITIALTISIPVSVYIYVTWSRNDLPANSAPVTISPTFTNEPINNPAPVTTSPPVTSECPTALQAAQSVGDDPSHVRENGEFCAFRLADGTPRTIHCPIGLGQASLQASLATGQEGVYIIACDGVNATPYAIYGATLRFLNWEPDGDACTIHQKDPSAPVIGTTCP